MISFYGLALSNFQKGIRLRRHIGLALKRRSEAVQRALSHYNAQAVKLNPQRRELTWKEAVDMGFLGEFDLLRLARLQSKKQWMKPAVREATTKYLKVSHAREEIERLNVEVRRLRKSIEDEKKCVKSTLERLEEEGLHLLAGELRRRERLRSEINGIHLELLDRLEMQPYFTGHRESGMRDVDKMDGHVETLEEEIEEENRKQQDFELVADFILAIDD